MKMKRVLLLFFALFPLFAFGQRPNAPEANIAPDVNRFAWDLYRHVAEKPGNLCFSPFGVALALGAVHSGTYGDTAAQIAQTFYFKLPIPGLHYAMGDLLKRCDSRWGTEKLYHLALSHSILGSKGDGWSSEFSAIPQYHYGGSFKQIEFSPIDPDPIMGWYRKTFPPLCSKLPKSPSFDPVLPDSKLLLLSVATFKGAWLHGFRPANTKDAMFVTSDHASTSVKLMFLKGRFPFLAGKQCKLIELPLAFETKEATAKDNLGSDALCSSCSDKPFSDDMGRCSACKRSTSSGMFRLCAACGRKEGKCQACNDPLPKPDKSRKPIGLSMVLILPENDAAMHELEKHVGRGALPEWLDKAQLAEVNLSVPRFAMYSHLNVKDALKTFGVKDLFDSEKANLSRMSSDNSLYLSQAHHESYVEMDEKGSDEDSPVEKPEPFDTPKAGIEFRADKPFLFLIRETCSGVVYFMGRVVNP